MHEKVTVVALIDHLGRGGSERQLFLTMVHLDPALFERHIVVFNRSPHAVYDDALRDAGVRVWLLPDTCRTIRQRLQYLVRLLRKLKADVVHSWTIHDNPYAGLAGRLAKVPVRWGSLRGSLKLTGFQALPSYFRYASLHLVSRIMVNAPSLQAELEEAGIKPQRIILLPNIVIVPVQSTTAVDLSDLGITEAHRVVGTVGNVRQVKNQQLLIEALAEIIRLHEDVRGIIVGQSIPSEADLPSQLQVRIDELGLRGRVVMAGFRADIPQLMQRLNVFCLTSRREGTPNALLEAMAAGCPVVATAVGGIPNIVLHERNGLLVPSENAKSLTSSIQRLLENEAFAKRLGNAARQTVAAEHSFQPIVNRLSDLYQQAVS